jgi:hypothetical protein
MSRNLTELSNINSFFEAYGRALESADTKMMVMHYSLPCLFLSDDSSSAFNDANKLEALFNQATLFYKQFGIVHARPDVWTKRSITNKIVKVKVNWQYYNADNQPVYNCDYEYVLKPDKKGKWKIELSIDINEKERMQQWQEKK